MVCRSTVFLVLFFFFFQAEDGIRDLIVTGVQTCALPIWTHPWHQLVGWAALDKLVPRVRPELHVRAPPGGLLGGIITNIFRSEERRVGEEWRTPWSPDH